MKINYDPEVDILRILLSEAPIQESDEVETGIIFDYDPQGNVVGIEILDASKRYPSPPSTQGKRKKNIEKMC